MTYEQIAREAFRMWISGGMSKYVCDCIWAAVEALLGEEDETIGDELTSFVNTQINYLYCVEAFLFNVTPLNHHITLEQAAEAKEYRQNTLWPAVIEFAKSIDQQENQ